MRHKTETNLFSQPDGIMGIHPDNTYVENSSLTEQLSDCIIVNGEFKDLNSYPLEQYWTRSGKERPSFATSYNCTRGYTAIWHLRDNQLFLLGVDGFIERRIALIGNISARFTLAALGLSRAKLVKADWFSGELRVPQRKPSVGEYNGLRFEKEIIINIDKGDLMKTAPIDVAQKSFLPHPEMVLRTDSTSWGN